MRSITVAGFSFFNQNPVTPDGLAARSAETRFPGRFAKTAFQDCLDQIRQYCDNLLAPIRGYRLVWNFL
jgi:hypothetical protein